MIVHGVYVPLLVLPACCGNGVVLWTCDDRPALWSSVVDGVVQLYPYLLQRITSHL